MTKTRTLIEGKLTRLYSEYNNGYYKSTVNTTAGDRLIIEVEFEGANDPAMFQNFEEMLLCFNTISSLELILQQIKSICWENANLSKAQKIEICAFKKKDVLFLKILEIDGKLQEYIRPTYHGIIVVYRNNSWECYDEDGNFHLVCNGDDDKIQILGDKSRVVNKIPLFRNLAKNMIKEVFC